MKHIIIPFALLFLLLLSCGKTSELSEEAIQRGKHAAHALIITDRDNEMAMQAAILEAKATKSEYLIIGDTIAANDFENAYAEYLKKHCDSLATIIF